ncbi:MAG TPA: class I SAM-dependent methyltransferase [Burkholderiaceae bacterium]|nr:class I SAM-dependent methyltransferase [Burkholderiaceae bacterium]
MTTHADEVASGERFAFGANWAAFLGALDETWIADAEASLRAALGLQSLEGMRLLDIGSGSGVFSLAARRLGAHVHSFDYDPQSVACTRQLRARRDAEDNAWRVDEGSVLDASYMASLGTFDIVYSWGVLHHTGSMWQALRHAAERVAPEGRLYIAIYNDQGGASRMWLRTKRAYNALPGPLRWLVLGPALLRLWGPTTIRDLLAGRPFTTWRTYRNRSRGMDPWRDVVDWVGGLPFEVAKPEEVFNFLKQDGFCLEHLVTCAGGHGCNEYVFVRKA